MSNSIGKVITIFRSIAKANFKISVVRNTDDASILLTWWCGHHHNYSFPQRSYKLCGYSLGIDFLLEKSLLCLSPSLPHVLPLYPTNVTRSMSSQGGSPRFSPAQTDLFVFKQCSKIEYLNMLLQTSLKLDFCALSPNMKNQGPILLASC